MFRLILSGRTGILRNQHGELSAAACLFWETKMMMTNKTPPVAGRRLLYPESAGMMPALTGGKRRGGATRSRD